MIGIYDETIFNEKFYKYCNSLLFDCKKGKSPSESECKLCRESFNIDFKRKFCKSKNENKSNNTEFCKNLEELNNKGGKDKIFKKEILDKYLEQFCKSENLEYKKECLKLFNKKIYEEIFCRDFYDVDGCVNLINEDEFSTDDTVETVKLTEKSNKLLYQNYIVLKQNSKKDNFKIKKINKIGDIQYYLFSNDGEFFPPYETESKFMYTKTILNFIFFREEKKNEENKNPFNFYCLYNKPPESRKGVRFQIEPDLIAIKSKYKICDELSTYALLNPLKDYFRLVTKITFNHLNMEKDFFDEEEHKLDENGIGKIDESITTVKDLIKKLQDLFKQTGTEKIDIHFKIIKRVKKENSEGSQGIGGGFCRLLSFLNEKISENNPNGQKGGSRKSKRMIRNRSIIKGGKRVFRKQKRNNKKSRKRYIRLTRKRV